MPTTKKRIYIVLSWELEDSLNRLARNTKIPRASVARLFLEEAVPSLNQLSEILESENNEEMIETYRQMVKKLQKKCGELPLNFD